MDNQRDFLARLIKKLESQGIAYMVSGSSSSSLYGQPRATKDVDIVIAATEGQLRGFVESLGEDYYVSIKAVREAITERSMFNVIDNQTGWKADFIIRKDTAFGLMEFERRLRAGYMGLMVWAASPEDTILSKLEWGRDSQSEQQFRDALGVAVVQWGRLDQGYLRKWAGELQVKDTLEELLRQAGELTGKE